MLQGFLYLSGLTLSSVAAYYSVVGLAQVFSGSFMPVIIMGSALEVAKIVAASWMFRHWRTAPRLLTLYLVSGILALMLLTSIGIFGFLSKSYLVQQTPITAMAAELAAADRAVALAQEQYDRDATGWRTARDSQSAEAVVNRLTATDRLTGTSGAVSVLRQQQQIQQTLQKTLATSATALKDAESARATLQRSFAEQTIDVGPLMFVAQAWYGNTDIATVDRAVRWLILLIMSAFDPMAIALLLAAQHRSPPAPIRQDAPVTSSPSPDSVAPSAPVVSTPLVPDPFDTPTAAEFSTANIEPAMEIDVTTPTSTTLPPAVPSRARASWRNKLRRTRIAPKH